MVSIILIEMVFLCVNMEDAPCKERLASLARSKSTNIGILTVSVVGIAQELFIISTVSCYDKKNIAVIIGEMGIQFSIIIRALISIHCKSCSSVSKFIIGPSWTVILLEGFHLIGYRIS